MNTYKKLVEQAAEKFEQEVLPQGNVLHGALKDTFSFVLNSDTAKQLIEQIASEAIENAAWSGYGGESFVNLDLEWFKTFMGGDDESK